MGIGEGLSAQPEEGVAVFDEPRHLGAGRSDRFPVFSQDIYIARRAEATDSEKAGGWIWLGWRGHAAMVGGERGWRIGGNWNRRLIGLSQPGQMGTPRAGFS